MLEQGTPTIVSLVVRSNTLPKTAHKDKEKGKGELGQTSLTSTLKRTPSMKEAKPKGVEWCWSKAKWTLCHSMKGKSSSKT
jgi:hypothetical protein